MQTLLNKGLAQLQSQGQPLKQRISPEGYTLIEPATNEPSFGWAIVNDYYVYALGPRQLEQAVTDLHNKKTHANGLASPLGTKHNASTVILRLAVLSTSLETLVEDAGLAPQRKARETRSRSIGAHQGPSASLEFSETSVRLI